MKHGRQAGTKSIKRVPGTARYRHLDALARTALALAIGMGLPVTAAARHHVQPRAHDGHKPAVVKAANGTPVVNIVAPGKHGLSHNVYSRFDVGNKGLILNNSASISKTQLAGYIYGNANLKASGPASVILNEVTSTRSSQLKGYMEVAGAPATVIVANPNGIACDGCGFINTPRAVLTTGKPIIGNHGRLSGFRVTHGAINIRGAGLDASHVDRVDLLARAIKVNGKLWAKHLNMVAGANRIDVDDLSTQVIAGTGAKPDVSIDVAALGGMYANAIHLVGTEAGVGVNIAGEAAARAGNFTLTSAGKVVVGGQVTATGTVIVGAVQNVDVQGVVASGKALTLRGGDLDLGGTVYSDRAIHLDADGHVDNRGQVQAHGGQLTVSAGGDVSNAVDGVMYAGKAVGIHAATLANAGGIEAGSSLHVATSDALTNAGVMQVDGGTLTLVAQWLGNTGTLSAAGNVNVTAAGKLASSGQLIAGHDAVLKAGTLLSNTGVVQADDSLRLSAHDLANSGELHALGGAWQANLAGTMTNAAEGDIYAGGNLGVSAAGLVQHGLLEAGQALVVDTRGALANDGIMQSDHAALNLHGGSLDNAGTLSAAGDMTLDADTTLMNTATAVATGDITLEGHGLTLGGSVKAGQGLHVLDHGDTLVSGKLYALGGLLGFDVAGTLSNQADGDIYGGQSVTIKAASIANGGVVGSGGNMQAAMGQLDNQGRMQSQGSLTLASDTGITNTGTVYASKSLDVGATTLHNEGTLRGGTGLVVDIRGNARNTGTAYTSGAARWNVDGTLDNRGVLAASADTRVQAGAWQGAGTLAAGLKNDGSLGTDGRLEVHAAHVLQAGGRILAAGNIVLSGSTLNLDGSRVFAGGDADLTAGAGDITLRGAQLTAGDTASFSAGTLVNGGESATDGGQISAHAVTLDIDSLDNRYGQLQQSGSGDMVIHLQGDFDNAHGLLATDAGHFLIEAASLVNAHGSIQHAGSGLLTLKIAGGLDNRDGVIAGNGNLAADLDGAFDNAGGRIGLLGDMTLHAASLDNQGGILAGDKLGLMLAGNVDNGGGVLQSSSAFGLDAAALTNGSGGQVKVTGDSALRITLSGALDNAANAFVGGSGDVTVQAAQLANAGQIYAGNTLDMTTTGGTLDNDGGTLQSMGSMILGSAAALDNASGRIESGADTDTASLHVDAVSLNNHGGRLANAGTGATVIDIRHDIDNRGGTLGGQGNVQLDGARLDNSHAGRLVARRDFILSLAHLGNANGTVYAARDLTWHARSASLTNAGGSFGSGRNLALTLGHVGNTNGDLDAGNNVSLDLARLTGSGRIVAGNNLGLVLPGDYTTGSGNTLKANGDVAITVGGDFTNRDGATLEAVQGLSIHADNIRNGRGAFVNSADTQLVATHELTNKGRIEGNNVQLTARTLTNLGTVIGSTVTAQAHTLTNGADLGKATDNHPYQSALMAATSRLNLYVTGTLLNRDATLFTTGDMMLAANASGRRSHAIINRSGDIEADGNLVIAAQQVTNERRYYKFETFGVSGNTIVGWDGQSAGTLARTQTHALRAMLLPPTHPGDPGVPGGGGIPSNTRTDVVMLELSDAPVMDNICNNLPDGWQCKPGALVKRVDTWTVTSATVLTAASAESRMLAGKNITLNGSLLNDASTIAAGRNLVINQVNQSGEVDTGTIGGERVRNIAHAPTVQFQHKWTASITEQHRSSCGFLGTKHCWDDDGKAGAGPVYDNTPPPDGDTSFVTLDLGPALSARIKAGRDVDITAHDIDNTVVDADGNPVHGAIALGSNEGGHAVAGDPVSGADNVAAGHGSAGNVTLGQAPGGSTDHGQASTAPPQTVDSLTGPDAHIPLPQSGLYTINTDPDSSYLIETDPRFANYAKFISSDYLLDKLGYDPANMDKRLGDGFYEQRQILNQVTELTGRRFLGSATDALSQYRALMDNAEVAATRFEFQVGVALTAEQMANLTRDIVWLVDKTVDGQSVLVPVVYLSQAHATQLNQSGAVIAGRNVILNASGNVRNNGSILASQSASIKADNLLNNGTLAAGGDLSVKAAHDILNQGGIIRGANVSLVAGNDIVSSADVGPVHLGGVNLAKVDTGSIHATHNLRVLAGRDMALDKAHVNAGGDMALVAGRDLAATATTLHAGQSLAALAGRDISLKATSSRHTQFDGHTLTSTTTHHASQLSAGGPMSVTAGRDIISQGAQLTTAGTLGVTAGRDLELGTVTDHTHTRTQWRHGDTSGTTVTDDDTVHGTLLHGKQGVALAAGRDANLTAADIASTKGNVSLAAGRDIHLNAATENHTRVEDTYTHDSGFLSSSTTTTHDVSDNDIAIATGIKGKQVSLMAGHDLASHGASVQAGKALVLGAGHDVTLGAADNTYRSQHHRHHEDSGFGIGTLTGTFDDGLYTKNTDDQQDMVVDHVATGTLLSGDTIHVTAGHDLTTVGAQVAATRQLVMAAGHDLVIDAAANTHGGKHQHKHRVDGWQRNGLVNMVGTTKSRQRARGDEVSYAGSLIGSTQGEVALIAGHNVHITGSDVISQAGTTITGQNVTIDAALGGTDGHREFSMHRAGIMGGIGGQIGNLANSAYGAYRTAKRGGRSEDSRLKALYAAKAGYQAYDAYRGMRGVSANGVSGGIGTKYQTDKTGRKTAKAGTGTGISVKISLGASTANSHADTHDDMAYGSHIKSRGDVTIAATNGDLDIIGSQIKGQNVALAASHDLKLLSQVEQHTQKQSGAHAGGQIGVSIGQTTGIFLSVNGGKARAHGNGTTHAITTVDAVDTLSIKAGHDAILRGAQARGNTLLAGIGHNLTLESEQDTGDFASKQWEAGLTLVYGWSSGSVGVSGHASAAGMKHHYKSVTQVTGLAAGDGGFQIHVGGNTDLTGAVIASTADAYKNWLDTGSLSWSDLHNEAKYSSWSVSVGGGAGTSPGGQSMAGLSGGIGIPQSHDQSSTTEAGIAQGTITVRHGNTSLVGLNRNPDINAKGLTNRFDRKELAEQQEMGHVAGYVGMRTVGMIAKHEQKLAARDLANATTDKDAAEAQARLDRWSTGGTYKDILHGMVGAATATLGGGNALNGALGATASEMASGQMEQYLVAHHINPDSPKGRSLMELASTAIGAAAGGGAGAATALQGEKYNRQLHVDTIDYITKHMAVKFAEAHDMTVLDAQRILLRQAMRMTDDYNDRFLSTTDSPEVQAAAKAFLTGHNPAGVDGYLYDLFPSAEDKANSKMGAYDLVNNKAAYGAVLDALATGMMKKSGQASMKDYQTDMWALDGRYRDRGTGLAWDEAWRHHVNQEDLAFLKFYGETALAGATAGVGAEFAVLGGVLSGGVSGYMTNGWKGAMVGAVVGGTVGKVAPGLTNSLAPMTMESGVGVMFGRTVIFSGVNGAGSGLGTILTNAWIGKEWSDDVMPSVAMGALAPVASGESFFWGAGGDLVFGVKAADGFGWATGALGVGAAGVDPNSKYGFRDDSVALQTEPSSMSRGHGSVESQSSSGLPRSTCTQGSSDVIYGARSSDCKVRP